jgi:DNA-binding transcriptional LysR family regulator
MDRATEMAVLVASIEHGGFTAAAERLGLTPSAVSKAVTRLERRLGTKLLARTTRRIALTTEGQTYFDAAKRILADLDDVESTLMARQAEVSGRVRINVGVAFAVYQLAPVLTEFRRRHPDVQLELSISDHIVDVIGSGIDVAIRTGPIGDDRLVGRRFADIRRVICASPDYLAEYGMPRAPEDLTRHTCINVTTVRHFSLWPFRTKAGVVTIDTAGAAMVDNAIGCLALGIAGFGIVRLGDLLLKEAIENGQLVPILTEHHVAETVPLQLVFPPGRQRVPRVAAFLDFIAERFRDSPWQVAI